MTKKQKNNLFVYIFYLVIFIFFVFPLLWVLSMSLRPYSSGNISSLFSGAFTLHNYKIAIHYSLFLKFLYNGIKVSGLQGIVTLIICLPASYGFSRFEFKHKHLLLFIILMFQMVSGMVTIIPLYRYFQFLHLTDTHLGLVIAYASASIAFTTWLLKGYFDTIPKDLDEAAMLDGCTRFQSFRKIALPLAVPGMSAAFILNVVGGWANFMVPYILLTTPSKMPIAVGILTFAGSVSAQTPELLAAGTVLSLAPAVVIFLLLQKYIVNSIGGAVKG